MDRLIRWVEKKFPDIHEKKRPALVFHHEDLHQRIDHLEKELRVIRSLLTHIVEKNDKL